MLLVVLLTGSQAAEVILVCSILHALWHVKPFGSPLRPMAFALICDKKRCPLQLEDVGALVLERQLDVCPERFSGMMGPVGVP